MPTSTRFSELLKKARLNAGVTQSELAKAIGKSGMYISNIEKGKNLPPPHNDDLLAMADKLSLIGQERNMFIDTAAADRATLPPKLLQYILQCPALKELIRAGAGEKIDNAQWEMLLNSFTGGTDHA